MGAFCDGLLPSTPWFTYQKHNQCRPVRSASLNCRIIFITYSFLSVGFRRDHE